MCITENGCSGQNRVSVGAPLTVCSTISLLELAELVSEMMLEFFRLVVLGNFNSHAEAILIGADFMSSMTTMGLSRVVFGPTHTADHTQNHSTVLVRMMIIWVLRNSL